MPGLRRQGRVLALQLLYQAEISGGLDDNGLERFWNTAAASKRARAFAAELYRTVQSHQGEIDATITANLENWRLIRLSVMVRNLLRLATGEIVYADDTPDAVAIDEAISLAKEYVDDEAARFVNGVLDRIATVNRESGAPPPASPAG